MRACLTSVLFLATIVASFAAPVRPVDWKALMFRSLRNAHHETQIREKRQIPDDACVNAIQEAQSPLFMQCSNFLGNANALSFNQLLSFCGTDNCVPLLIKVFTDLESCGDDGNSTVSMLYKCILHNNICTKAPARSIIAVLHTQSGNCMGS